MLVQPPNMPRMSLAVAAHHAPQAFDRKVQLLREVAAKLTLAVQACSLHRHIADMSTLIQDLASSGDDTGSIDIGASVVHLAQALQDSAAAESQCSVLLQDMLFQIDNVLKFDVARAVALIISMEEAREALLSAMSKTRVRSTRPGPDEGRRRLQAEEYAAASHAACEWHFFPSNVLAQPIRVTYPQVSSRTSGAVRPPDRLPHSLPRRPLSPHRPRACQGAQYVCQSSRRCCSCN